MVGLAGESQNFDGNGSYTRFQPGGGAYPVQTASRQRRWRRPLFGNASSPPLGTRPARPARKPPYKPQRGVLQATRSRTSTPRRRGRAREARDPQAPARLHGDHCPARRGARRVGYILSQQRFYLPAWVPVLGTDFYKVKAEFPTGQAVVPARGRRSTSPASRSARSARSSSRTARAVVTMNIQQEVRADLPRRHRAAAAQDRPEGHVSGAGPGHEEAGALPRAGRSRSRTRCPT